MRNTIAVVSCLLLVLGMMSCKPTMLPDNATQWLTKFEAIGNESVEVAKKAKDLDRTNQAAVEAHNKSGMEYQERLNVLLEEGKKIGDALPGPLQRIFTDKITKITEKVESAKANIQ